MTKKLTITVSDDVYEGLYTKVGPRRIGRFLERLARPYVVERELERSYRRAAALEKLEALYREAAQDEEREREAHEWSEAMIGECLPDEPDDAAR